MTFSVQTNQASWKAGARATKLKTSQTLPAGWKLIYYTGYSISMGNVQKLAKIKLYKEIESLGYIWGCEHFFLLFVRFWFFWKISFWTLTGILSVWTARLVTLLRLTLKMVIRNNDPYSVTHIYVKAVFIKPTEMVALNSLKLLLPVTVTITVI